MVALDVQLTMCKNWYLLGRLGLLYQSNSKQDLARSYKHLGFMNCSSGPRRSY